MSKDEAEHISGIVLSISEVALTRPPQLKTWLPWSELARTPRLTLGEFRSVLCQYPRSALLIACARLSMIFNYGPDAKTAANEEATAKWIPILFPPGLVPRVKTFASQGRVIFFQGQLRYLAAEVTRLERAHGEDSTVVPDAAIDSCRKIPISLVTRRLQVK